VAEKEGECVALGHALGEGEWEAEGEALKLSLGVAEKEGEFVALGHALLDSVLDRLAEALGEVERAGLCVNEETCERIEERDIVRKVVPEAQTVGEALGDWVSTELTERRGVAVAQLEAVLQTDRERITV